MPLELGIEMRFYRIADTQISNERPTRRNIKSVRDFVGIEDRDPTDPKASGPRRQPERLDGGDNGIPQHLRHGAPPQTMSIGRLFITEHRKMNRSLSQPFELETGIKARPLLMIGLQSFRVAPLETRDDSLAHRRGGNMDEAPGLAVADGRRQCGNLDQRAERLRIDRIGTEAPDIPAPPHQLGQLLLKRSLKLRLLASP